MLLNIVFDVFERYIYLYILSKALGLTRVRLKKRIQLTTATGQLYLVYQSCVILANNCTC